MDFSTLPIWLVALLIFGLRIVDVSLGTFRTLTVVQGHTLIAMVVGFVEVAVWVVAVTHVVTSVDQHPWLVVAYAGGFAAGNATGMAVERRLALGTSVIRLITTQPPAELQQVLTPLVTGLACFAGTGDDGTPRTLFYAACARRDLPRLVKVARDVDPNLFFVVERFSQMSPGPLARPTGWRARFARK